MNKITFVANNTWNTLNLDMCVAFHADCNDDEMNLYVTLPSGNVLTYKFEDQLLFEATCAFIEGEEWICNPITDTEKSNKYVVLTKNNVIKVAPYDREHSCFQTKSGEHNRIVKVYSPAN